MALIGKKNNLEKSENNFPVELVNTDSLMVHPDNPRQGDIGAIVTSIENNGWFGTLVVQKDSRRVLAGNHRLQAAQHLGINQVPVYWVDVNDVEAKRILLSDNRTSDLATYDDHALSELLKSLAEEEELSGSGYEPDDIDELLANLDEPLVFEPEELSEREMSNLPDVTIADPDFEPPLNSVWKLGPHILVVADIITGWKLWKPYLEGDVQFVPYPGPFVAVAADSEPGLVLVHPDKYMAGHVITKWNSLHDEAEQMK